jgi:hypothetical protein
VVRWLGGHVVGWLGGQMVRCIMVMVSAFMGGLLGG